MKTAPGPKVADVMTTIRLGWCGGDKAFRDGRWDVGVWEAAAAAAATRCRWTSHLVSRARPNDTPENDVGPIGQPASTYLNRLTGQLLRPHRPRTAAVGISCHL